MENSNLMDVVLNSGYLDILFYPLNMLIELDVHYEVNEGINPIRHQVFKTIFDILSILIEKHGDENEVQRYLRNDGDKQGLQILSYITAAYLK